MSLRSHAPVRAVLFDLDDVVDEVGEAVPGARRAVQALRAAGLQVGIVVEPDDVTDVDDLLGPVDLTCPCSGHDAAAHGAAVRAAAERFEVDTAAVVLVGATAADVSGAHEAGAASILVTDDGTTPSGVEDADVVVDTVADAAALVLHSTQRVPDDTKV